MSELTATVLRFGLLVLIWAFVFAIVGVLRGDLYGTRVVSRASGRRPRTAPQPPVPAPESEPRRSWRAERTARKSSGNLTVIEGSLRGTTLPLADSGVLVGRNPECSLVLGDDFASGRHARVYAGEDGWYVDDLGSTNGTFVDNQRITGPTRLDVGSRMRIGQTVLELRK